MQISKYQCEMVDLTSKEGKLLATGEVQLCFRLQWGVGVPCLTFGGPAPYLNGACADHAQPPIPVLNLGRARLAGPPVSRYHT